MGDRKGVKKVEFQFVGGDDLMDALHIL